MAQTGRSKSHLSYFTRKQPLPTSNLHPQNKGTSSPHGHWSEPTTPTFGNQDNWSSPKKSVLIKVKEKAKKLRQILAKKLHAREENNPIPPEEATLHKKKDENVTVHHFTPGSDVATDACNGSASVMKPTVQLPAYTSTTASVSDPRNKEPEVEKSNNKVLQQPVLDNAAVEHVTIPETIVIPTSLNNPAIKEKSMDDIPIRKDRTSSNSNMGKGKSEVLRQLALDNAAVEHLTIPETTRLKYPTINEKSSNEIPVSKCSRSSCIEKGNNKVLRQQTLDYPADEHITIPDTAVVTTSLNNPCISEKSKDEIPVSKDRSSTEKDNNEVLQQPTLDNAAIEHLTIPDTAVMPTSLNNPAMNEKSSDEIPDSKDSRSAENGKSGVIQQPAMNNPAFNYVTIPEAAMKATSLNNPAINEKSSNEVSVTKERSSSSCVEEGNRAVLQQRALDNDAVEYTTAPETATIPTSLNNDAINEKSKDERLVSTDRSRMEKGNNEVLQQLALDNAAVGYVNIPESAMKPTSLNPSTNEKSSDEIPVSKDSNSSSTEKGNRKVLQQLTLDDVAVDCITVTETVSVPTNRNPVINEKTLDEIQVIKDRGSRSNNNNSNSNSSSNNNKNDSSRYSRSSSCKTLSKKVTDMLSPAYAIVSGATQTINSKIQKSSGPVYEIAAKQVWDRSVSVKDYSVSTDKSSMEKGNNEVLQQLALDNAAVGYVHIPESAMKLTSLNPSTNEKSSDEIPVSKDRNSSSMEKGNSKVLQQLALDNAAVDYITITESIPVPTNHNPVINEKSLDEIQAIKDRSCRSNNNNNNSNSSSNNNQNDSNRYSRSSSCKTLSKTVTDMLSPAYFLVSGATQAIASRIQEPSRPDSNRYNRSNSCKTLSKTVTNMLSPAYTAVSGATQAIASKIQESSGPVYEAAAKQVWDKSISVKDYLMQKLEPGEEDRALCKVITAAVSPKIVSPASEEVAIVNKEVVLVKEEIEGSAIAAISVPTN